MATRNLRLLRFMVGHGLLGMAIGAVAGLVLIVEDVGGLASLLARSPSGPVAAMALIALLATTCGGVQMAFALGLLGAEGEAEAKPCPPLPTRARQR